MAKSPLSVKRPSTLSAYKPSLREQAAILGEKGFKALTGREPGYEARENINRYTGLLDLLEVPGAVLSANEAARNIKSKQYGAAAGDIAGLAAGAIPIAGGALKKGAKKVVEEGVEGAGRLIEKYDLNKILKSSPEPAEYIEKGSEQFVFSDPTSGGRMAVVTRPTGPRSASVIDLHVPEEYRGTGVGRTLQAAVLRDFPSLGGQVSSKAAAKNAYAAGRRMAGNEGASLEDIFKAIDENSSVNLWTPENLTTKYDLPPVITGAEREANLARFMEGSHPLTINADGSPKTFYHGTKADIESFDPERIANSDLGSIGQGFYASEHPDLASFYSSIVPVEGNPNVMPIHINAKNPFVYDLAMPFKDKAHSKEFTDRLKEMGHDAIVKYNRDGSIDEIVSLYPNKMKSKYNIGTFDPTTPHIGKAHGGPVSLSDKYGC